MVLEAGRWASARHYGFQCSYGVEESLKSLGAEVTILTAPNAHEVDANSPLSWLRHYRALCGGKTFDQVWFEICHSRLDEGFLAWLAETIPVRLGFMPDCMEFNPAELVNNPMGARRRVENLTRNLKYVTHLVPCDEIDAAAFNAQGQIPAYWWGGGNLPQKFIDLNPPPPQYDAGTFYGAMYGVRAKWLHDPRLAGLIVQPNDTPESRSDCAARFDAASIRNEESLMKSASPAVAQFKAYCEEVREIRREGMGLWLRALQLGSAVINLPQFGKSYSSRVTEGMAAGRPVVSWEVEGRPRTKELFVPGEEILLFSQQRPDELVEHLERLRREPKFAQRIVENARRKLLRDHTTEAFVQRLIEWLPEAEKPAKSSRHSNRNPAGNEQSNDFLSDLQARKLWAPGQPLRLHLGCGENRFDGYVNIDFPPSEHTAQTIVGADIFADITQLALPSHCVDEIRMHHVFEHFTRPQALALLISWHECLKIGGLLRLETPDVMGCAEQLVSDQPYRVKQAVLRHCFGSQEAHWANHYDGWHADKYVQTLGPLGFAVNCRRWRWSHEPWLANVEASGVKQRHLSRVDLLAAADKMLEDFMALDVPSERTIWNVWRNAMRAKLIAPAVSAPPSPAAPVGSAPACQPVFNSLLTQADAEFARQEWLSAGRFLFLAHLVDPKQPQVLPALASVYANAKEFQAATEVFASAIKNSPEDPNLYVQIALCHLQLKRPKEAGAALRQALTVCPDHPAALKVLADCHRDRGSYKDAGLLYGKLINRHPDQVDVHLSLTKCLFELGDFNGAKAALEYVLRIDPANQIALDNQAALVRTMSSKTNSSAITLDGPSSVPTTPANHRGPTQGIIFSKDRALQLDATLASFLARCQDASRVRLVVLYTTTTEDNERHYRQLATEYPTVTFHREKHFASDVRSLIGDAAHVLFLVDDNLFVRNFTLQHAISGLEQDTEAIGFSLRLGRNTVHCYPVNRSQRLPEFRSTEFGALSFDWPTADLDFAYPLEVSSSLYRGQDLAALLGQIEFNSPNSLEARMAEYAGRYCASHPRLFCFDQSVTFCNPLNKVQSECPQNRAAAAPDSTAIALAGKYEGGFRVDVAAYLNFIPRGCHEEGPLRLKTAASAAHPPIASVVILCHNYAAHLPAAVGGVLAQTFSDFELLIIDDGSNDDSLAVAQQLSREHPGIPIRTFRLDDVGPSAARRFGFEQALGRYVLPLDADDKIEPDFLSKTVPVLEADPKLGFAYVNTRYFGESDQHCQAPEYNFDLLCRQNYIPYCSLLRRAAFMAVDGYDRANWGYFEDWDLWLRLGQAGWAGRHVAETLFQYQHHFSSSLSYYAKRLDGVYKAYVVCQRPQLYIHAVVTEAKALLAEMPPGWHTRPPMRDPGSISALLKVNSGNRHLLYFLAMAQHRAGATVAAVATLRELLRLHPHDQAAKENLAEFSNPAPKPASQAEPPKTSVEKSPPDRTPSVRVMALISAYNEGDVIYHVIGDLVANGLTVYLIDNNSTDNTIAEASRWLGRGLVKVERFPDDAGPGYSQRCSKEYVWREILRRKEELAHSLGADWYIHADADEFRESPWPGKTLAQAITEVDRLGYNAINFELLNFRPTDDGFVPGTDVRQHLVAYDPAEFFDAMQIKAWKNPGQRVEIAHNGGHSISFPNRRVFPLNFILRHYPIRGESHGRRKVFNDRLPRYAQEEVAINWHVQYNAYADGRAKFLHDPSKLVAYRGDEVRAQLLSAYTEDSLLVAMLGIPPAPAGGMNAAALCTWVSRTLNLERPLTVEAATRADQLITKLLPTQIDGPRPLQLNLDPLGLRLLQLLLKAKIAFARFAGEVKLAQVGLTLYDTVSANFAAAAPCAAPPAAPTAEKSVPLVTICVPTYNGADFIAASIASALAQTYPAIELILSDDESSDETVALAEAAVKNAPFPVTLLRHARLGLVENWNFCLQKAQGKYVKFLFQDDFLEPDCIAQLVAIAESDPEIGLVFSPRQIELPENGLADPALAAAFRDGVDLHRGWTQLAAVQSGAALLQDPKLFENPINKIGEPTTVLLTLAAVERMGGFDVNLKQLVDVEMWLRLMTAYKIGFVDRPLSRFRLHRQQATQSNLKAGLIAEDWRRFFRKLAQDPVFGSLPAARRAQAAQLLARLGSPVSPPLQDVTHPVPAQEAARFRRALSETRSLVAQGRFADALAGAESLVKLAPTPEGANQAKAVLALVRDAQVQAVPATTATPAPIGNDFFGATEMTNIEQLIAAYTENPTTPETAAPLITLRQGLADFLNQAEDSRLEALFAGDFGRVYRALLACGLTANPRPIASGSDCSFPQLLACMLLAPAHLAAVSFDLARIPAWFRDDFLGYQIHAPAIFNAPGEADRYREHLLTWVKSIHHRIRTAATDPLTLNAALHFTLKANFIPLYFTEANTRELAEKRAAIMEFVLERNGATLNAIFKKRTAQRKKIKVGFLNAHFSTQTETHVTLPGLHLDRGRFEICLFPLATDGSPLEDRCRSFADQFILLPSDITRQVATIREAALDVIIIGTNITAVTNPVALLALHRLAPLQLVSYCSPVSTGMRHVDGYLTGTLANFPGAAKHFSERLLLIDGTPGCLDYAVETPASGSPVTRRSLGIAEDEVVFLNAAACFKILPEMQSTWAKILQRVPKSRLVLLPFNPNWSNSFPVKQFAGTLGAAFRQHGVAEDRFILIPSQRSRAEVKMLEQIADVYLDTFPFSGSISVVDPLELGIPPVVWEGATHRSRMAAALLRELEIPELITTSEAAYIELSVQLATDIGYRRKISQRVLAGMARKPNFIHPLAYGAQLGDLLERLVRGEKWTKRTSTPSASATAELVA